MRTALLIVTTFILALTFAAPAAKGVSLHSEQGQVAVARIFVGSANASDGRLLHAGDWIWPGETLVTSEGRPTIIITTAAQALFAPKPTVFLASHNPLALYCAGCKCGCGSGSFEVAHPDGDLSQSYCDSLEGTWCVDPSDGGLQHTGTCVAAFVPCD